MNVKGFLKKLSRKKSGYFEVLVLSACIVSALYVGKLAWENDNKVYYMENEEKKYPAIENAFCGEWEVIYSTSFESRNEGYMKKGESIFIYENEIKVDDDVLKNVSFISTLTIFPQGKEYERFFKENGYVPSYFEWIQGKDFYLYTLVPDSRQKLVFCMAEKNSMIIRYGDSIYYCEKLINEVQGNNDMGYFSGVCKVHDFGLDGGEVYEGRWIIGQAITGEMNTRMTGREIYFYRPDLGKMRIFYDGKMYRKILVRMDIIENTEGQKFDSFGSFDDLGVVNTLIPYVQFDLSDTDIEQIRGIMVISKTQILLVTDEAVYSCSRDM